jgi:hypothetical protein
VLLHVFAGILTIALPITDGVLSLPLAIGCTVLLAGLWF